MCVANGNNYIFMEFNFTIEENFFPKSRPAITINLLPQGVFYIYLYYHLDYVLF